MNRASRSVASHAAQHVQVDADRAVPDHQLLQQAAAGEEHTAARAARDQRPHLVEGADVVQHDQHPAVGEHAAVQRRALMRLGGDLRLRNAEGTQEPAEYDGGIGGLVGLVVTPHVGEEESARELVGDLVGPVDGQARLADARATRD